MGPLRRRSESEGSVDDAEGLIPDPPGALFWPGEILLQRRIATLEELETYYSIDDVHLRIIGLEHAAKVEELHRKRQS